MSPHKPNVDHLSYRELLIEEIIMFYAFGRQSQSTGANPDTTKANLIRLAERILLVNYHQPTTNLELKENASATQNLAFFQRHTFLVHHVSCSFVFQ